MAKRMRVLVAAMLVGYIAIIVSSQRYEAVTFNEFAHLPAGIAYWREGAFSIYNVNPPLSKFAAAVPALTAKPVLPSLGSGEADGSTRPEWEFGLAFLKLNRDEYRNIFALGRWASAVFLAIGAWCVWRWGRDLHGTLGAGFSLGLYLLCPNVLAAGQFVTPDAATTALMLVACYAHWRWLRNPTMRLAIWSGLALGAAELCKYTALLLYPAWCATWTVACLTLNKRSRICFWRQPDRSARAQPAPLGVGRLDSSGCRSGIRVSFWVRCHGGPEDPHPGIGFA